jgi:hypothetical protein
MKKFSITTAAVGALAAGALGLVGAAAAAPVWARTKANGR